MNSEFSFSSTSYLRNAKDLSLPNYLPRAEKRDGFMPFLRAWTHREMQTAVSRIWTQLVEPRMPQDSTSLKKKKTKQMKTSLFMIKKQVTNMSVPSSKFMVLLIYDIVCCLLLCKFTSTHTDMLDNFTQPTMEILNICQS